MSGHRARKSLGQNFLVDPNQQRRIVEALQPESHDVVIEIGPGQGALTRHLAPRVGRLILIELDRDLAPALKAEFAHAPHVSVLHADVLDVDLAALAGDMTAVKVIGNIPYNITTPIIFHLLQRERRPRMIVLMVQKEVADRIMAAPGTGEYGALSVGVRAVADVERVLSVARGSFRPVPRVDSTVIRITPHDPPRLTSHDEAALRSLTRLTFSQRRKQLQKVLRSSPHHALDNQAVAQLSVRTGIDLQQRPEQLNPEQMIELARALAIVAPDTHGAAP